MSSVMQDILRDENIERIQKMIRKGCSKEFILELDYTEDEYAEAEKELLQTM